MNGTGTGAGAAERRLDLDRAAELEKSYDSELRFRDLKGFAAPLVSTLLVARHRQHGASLPSLLARQPRQRVATSQQVERSHVRATSWW